MHSRPTLNRNSSTSTEEQLRQLLALNSTDPSTSTSSSDWVETLSFGTLRLGRGKSRAVIPTGFVRGDAKGDDDVVVKGSVGTPEVRGGHEEIHSRETNPIDKVELKKEAEMKALVSKILYEVRLALAPITIFHSFLISSF